MLQQPPRGEGRHVQQPHTLWALAAILLALTHIASATSDLHQPQSVDQHRPHTIAAAPSIVADHAVDRDRSRHRKPSSPLEGDRANRNLATTALPPYDSGLIQAVPEPAKSPQTLIKAPEVQRRKSAYPDSVQPDIALDTHYKIVSKDASAISATAPDLSVVAPPSRRLEDWEVEDFVLLATIDGDLYAADRKTGKERWHIFLDQPMVETKHHRANKSAIDADFAPIDQTIWAVEPTRDGQIYMWTPGADKGLVHTGLSMKMLVDDFGPYKNNDLIYTGDKKTTLLTLDAATGRAIQWHGPTASAAEENICARPQHVVAGGDMEECSSATITLGRTEYTVGISSTRGFAIATLKFSEWTPNVFDQDLLRQYSSTRDDVYITSNHDGQAFAFDCIPNSSRNSLPFSRHLPSPIAKAFDIMRPARSGPDGEDNDATLIALPQPPPPPANEQEETGRDLKIYLNQSQGNWYAMSGRAYPLITDAPSALINQAPSFALEPESFTPAELERHLVGQHTLDGAWGRGRQSSYPSLPGGSANAVVEMGQPHPPDSPTYAMDAPDPSHTVINMVKNMPLDAVNSTMDLIKNPLIHVLVALFVILYRKTLIHRIRGWAQETVHDVKAGLKQRGIDLDYLETDTQDESAEGTPEAEECGDGDSADMKTPSAASPVGIADASRSDSQDEAAAAIDMVRRRTPTAAEEGAEPEVKKKKAHRGRRGGKAQKKKKNSSDELATSVGDVGSTSVDDAVVLAKSLGERSMSAFEPDIRSVPGYVDEVSNPTFLIDGSLQVNEEQQLGMGSNGTVVYAGQWQNRPVAVKRMLRDFYDIASQETRLLREVDRHQNVIQYFAQLERGNFIYIALELCEASLADVMEKPSQFRQLADAGAKDTLAVLRQITMGLDHLHSLQIVHRDLKPQNILITMDRNKRKPRILVSDFGLCKKLEGGQSSFGATTAHAAGTSGWRAPELLQDDDGPVNTSPTFAESSTHSGSPGSQALEMPQRRVTRSIDIFSLGVVFFYVLTQGGHPFDCGDKYMREPNIRKATYSLDRLDILGDYQYEAKDLVDKMISADPKRRPKTLEILAHPFFWNAKTRLSFLCDVSDAFEKEPRDPPSPELAQLEEEAMNVTRGDFLGKLHKEFVESLGKQRKYTGSRLLDLLRALRNKRNHYHDMSESLQKKVGALPDGYLLYWTTRFPRLLLYCWDVVKVLGWHELDQFKVYYQPPETT